MSDSKFHKKKNSQDYKTSHTYQLNTNKNYLSSNIDPYSTLMVEDLLQGTSDWRNIQDIIRVTFKALTDIVKVQGESIKDLEKTITQKASKHELNSALTQKANVSEISRLHSEIHSKYEERPSLQDLTNILSDFTSKADVQYMLSSKIDLEEAKQLVKNSLNTGDIQSDIQYLNQKIEDFQSEFSQKMGNLSDQQQIEELALKLDQKANLLDMNIALEAKANKVSVQQALHRKMNKIDKDSINSQKDMQEILVLLREKADISTVDNLGHIVDNKADKSDIKQILNLIDEKVDKIQISAIENDISRKKLEIEDTLTEKIELINQDISKMHENVRNQLQYRGNLQQEIEAIAEIMNQKVEEEQLLQINNSTRIEISNQIEQIQEQLQKDQKQIQKQNLQNIENLQEELKKLNNSFHKLRGDQMTAIQNKIKTISQKQQDIQQNNQSNQEFENFKRSVQDILSKKLEKKDIQEIKKSINKNLDDKASIQEVQEALNICQQDISNRLIELKSEQDHKIKNIEKKYNEKKQRDIEFQNNQELDKQQLMEEINNALNSKPDLVLVQGLIEQKISVLQAQQQQLYSQNSQISLNQPQNLEIIQKEIEIITQEVNDQKQICGQIQNKQQDIFQQIQIIQKDLQLKVPIKDITLLLDTKASIEDINKALSELNNNIENKANQDDLNSVVTNQAIINESLCTENIVGRWTWKSGNLIQGNIVPWESQLVNTLPDNFIWNKQSPNCITTIAPGLYEIQYAFFTTKQPSIQISVNGQVILQKHNLILDQSIEQQQQSQENYQNGNITGYSLIEFLVLPANAQISIIYQGEEDTDALFGLKRL